MRFLKYIFLLLFISSYAQEDEMIQSIYFDFDKFDIRKDQQKELHKFKYTVIVMIEEKMPTIMIYQPKEPTL